MMGKENNSSNPQTPISGEDGKVEEARATDQQNEAAPSTSVSVSTPSAPAAVAAPVPAVKKSNSSSKNTIEALKPKFTHIPLPAPGQALDVDGSKSNDFFMKKTIKAGQPGAKVKQCDEVYYHYKLYLFKPAEQGGESYLVYSSRWDNQSQTKTKTRSRFTNYYGGAGSLEYSLKQGDIGLGKMDPVLENCLKTMELRENAQFLVSSNYAYGKDGKPASAEIPDGIPPDTNVLIEIQLIRIDQRTIIECALKGIITPPDCAIPAIGISANHMIHIAIEFEKMGTMEYIQKRFTFAADFFKKALGFVSEPNANMLKPDYHGKELILRFDRTRFDLYSKLCATYNLVGNNSQLIDFEEQETDKVPDKLNTKYFDIAREYGMEAYKLITTKKGIGSQHALARLYIWLGQTFLGLRNYANAAHYVQMGMKIGPTESNYYQLGVELDEIIRVITVKELESITKQEEEVKPQKNKQGASSSMKRSKKEKSEPK